MTVSLIHSLPIFLSVIQVFCGEEMAVVGYSVDEREIGYEAELGLTEKVSLEVLEKTVIKEDILVYYYGDFTGYEIGLRLERDAYQG